MICLPQPGWDMSPTEIIQCLVLLEEKLFIHFWTTVTKWARTSYQWRFKPGALALEMGKTGGFCSPSGWSGTKKVVYSEDGPPFRKYLGPPTPFRSHKFRPFGRGEKKKNRSWGTKMITMGQLSTEPTSCKHILRDTGHTFPKRWCFFVTWLLIQPKFCKPVKLDILYPTKLEYVFSYIQL